MSPAQAFGRWLRRRREARALGFTAKHLREADRYAKTVERLYDPPLSKR